MAKSRSFFGQRRGSTKSLTFQVVNGQQITKDRVSKVSNPKTQKQQYQRAIMATVMAAYSEMKEIMDHSFQGKKKGSENQREFMSRNLVAMRNAFAQYAVDNPLEANQEYFSVGPKTPTVLPGAWIISRGSLSKPNFLSYDDDGHKLVCPSFPTTYDSAAEKYSASVGDIANIYGVFPGLQVTFLTITSVTGRRIFEVYPQDFAGYGDWEFKFGRFVCKEFDKSKILTVDTDDPITAYEQLFIEFLKEIYDTQKSTIPLSDLSDVMDASNQHIWLDAEVALSSVNFDESLTGAFGVIYSKVDEDLRSNSQMIVRSPDMKGSILGLTWDYVWDAWRNAGASLGESDLYLEGGE